MQLELNLRISELARVPDAEHIGQIYDTICTNAARIFQIGKKVPPNVVLVALRAPQTNRPSLMVASTPWANASEKWAYFDCIKDLAAESQALAVMHIGECWMSSFVYQSNDERDIAKQNFLNGQFDHVRPSEDPNRKEAVVATMASVLTTPRNRSKMAYINRPRGGRPYLGKWEEFSEPPVGDLFDLLPQKIQRELA